MKNTSTPPDRPLKDYPRPWANQVIERLLQTYTREYNILTAHTNLSRRMMVDYLCSGAPEFPLIREILHLMRRWDDQQLRVRGMRTEWTLNICIAACSQILSKRNLPLLKLLTSKSDRLTIKEQVLQGIGGPIRPDGPPFFRQYLLWGGYDIVDSEGNIEKRFEELTGVDARTAFG